MRTANTRNSADYQIHPEYDVTATKNKQRRPLLNRAAITSLTRRFGWLIYQRWLKQSLLTAGLILVLTGPAFLLSDSFTILSLLMLNNILGILWGFVKFKKSKFSSSHLSFKVDSEA